jgi:hypothetical protein
MPKCKNPDVLHECSCGAHSMEKVIEQIEDQSLPFTEEKVGLVKIRTFDPTAPEHLFKWHYDEEDRWIEAVHENDWQFQFDDELPQSLEPKKIIQIPKGVIHRIIKGTSPLSVTIKT